MQVAYKQMKREFYRVLRKNDFTRRRAARCGWVFAENSLDGVHSHGVYRFPRFIHMIHRGFICVQASPALISGKGSLERWDGCLGPGPLNAIFCTQRAMELSRTHGIGCVALANTNHWMRGGYYGRLAARAGYIFIGWSNTIANMPAWGAIDRRLGNNPLVLAMPHDPAPVVLDMALSQFSYGAMENLVLEGKNLNVPGGYDRQGKLTSDPKEILASGRPLPVGYWKGAGLALLLDLLAAALSGGAATQTITSKGDEFGVSQVFIVMDPSRLGDQHSIATMVQSVLEYHLASLPAAGNAGIRYPGQRAAAIRQKHLQKGMMVHDKVWSEIVSL